MRRILAGFSFAAFTLTLAAQPAAGPTAKTKAPGQAAGAAAAAPALPSTIKDLPVRKVVLYKNGVGYFEHAGTVSGNQRVAIDFTSPQLNDVLQSLTVLDEGGGRIAGVNYNSTTPLAEQLKSLSLGMSDDPTSTDLFQALRGQRVEVLGAPGGPITGRLLSIESRTEKSGTGGDTVDKYYLTVVASSGAARVIELTPALSVRPLDANLQGQLDRYLELLSSTHSTGLRHLTLDALGQGQRELRVSYISEVPVWKSTYRMVFPRVPNGSAIVQGWAVVDNTVGADWDNVQLSLVAGAPQSFIQPLSQPLYTRRPEIPISTEAQLTPQTHEAAEFKQDMGAVESAGMANNQLNAPARLTGRDAGELVKMAPGAVYARSARANAANVALASSGNGSGVGMGSGYGAGSGGSMGGGLYRPSDALQAGDVSTNAFDDFFEYALTQPVTIHKNESAMVPILQQELPAEHVTLWSEREPTPLRAVWLENKSKLTLDSGSFSIFESGEFAGEGLLDPIHPGEKRLLSYAADQAVRVKVTDRDNQRTLHHVKIAKGVVIETHMDVLSVTYSAVNHGEADRMVLLEHPRRDNGWTLDEGLKADETAPDLYRFKLPVAAHSTAKLEVRERGPEHTVVHLNGDDQETVYLLDLVKRVPDALDKLKPVIDAQTAVADLDRRINESKKIEETAAADETRDRDNLTALKGNDAAKRFVDELNRAEDLLQATRKQTADLEQQKKAAVEKLNETIAAISFDWDEKAK
ncbi:MAG: hypothetical protein ABR924_05310 [Terracidiphilus sp.]|jgi:hypothetical protein